MTIKEFLLKVVYDGAGVKEMSADFQTAVGAGRFMGAEISNSAKLVNQQVSESFNSMGQKVRTVTSTLEENGKIWRVVFNDMGSSIKMVSQNAQTFGTVAGTLGGELEKITGRALLVAPAWMAMRFAMTEVIQLFQQSVQFMVEWETQMARIQVVSGATKDQMAVLSGQIQDISERFAMNSKDVAESANQWLRMGATLDDVIPRLEATAKLALISGMSMENAGKAVSSMMSSFTMNANEANTAIEKLIAIEEKSHTSLDVLTQAMEKSGLMAKTVGVSFDQLAGYIVAIENRTRQSGEVVGTQLRNMFKMLETSGASVVQNISGVPVYIDKLGQATVTNTGHFRNMNDILQELAKRWGTLGEAQQLALAKSMSRQDLTGVIALLDNMSDAISATGTKAEDSGKQIKEMTGTVDGSVKQLQTTWGRFLTTVGDTVGQVFSVSQALNAVNTAVSVLTTSLGGLHLLWDSIFHADKVAGIANSDEAARVQKDLEMAKNYKERKLESDAGTLSAPKQSEQQIKDAMYNIDLKAVATHESELNILKEKIKLLGDGITLEGKDLSGQLQSYELKVKQLQDQEKINAMKDREIVTVAQLKAEGASELQISIQKLAFLQEIKASQADINKAQSEVDTASINEYKGIQDEIVNALTAQSKAMGETAIQQVQNKINLEEQLGIHRQGTDMLKEQLELTKAISDQENKTPLERAKELKDLIKKTHSPDEYKETDRTRGLEAELTKRAEKKGISQDTIDSILHPDRSSVDRGGSNSLQTILQNTLTNPLGKNIGDLAGTIKLLADAINHPSAGPHLGTHGGSALTAHQRAYAEGAVPSYAQSFRHGTTAGKDVTVQLGGINVTVTAHTKQELQNTLQKELQELIANHMVRPDSKMNAAIKKVVDAF